MGKSLSAARRLGRAAVQRARTARDRNADQRVKQQQDAVRKAPARRRARRALRRSAARFHLRRLAAGVLGACVGVLGLVTTPLGRKLGWRWLQHPGQRLYARLAGSARAARHDRDQHIHAQRTADEDAAEQEAETDGNGGIADQVERPAALIPHTPTSASTQKGDRMSSGFNFEDAAAEMESAAGSYEPDGCMEILSMVEQLPEALTSIANIMKTLAERSDDEFPLEKEVAGGFNEIYLTVMAAVGAAEDLGPTFRQVHEQDIARHEDPRNGAEAEKGWNV